MRESWPDFMARLASRVPDHIQKRWRLPDDPARQTINGDALSELWVFRCELKDAANDDPRLAWVHDTLTLLLSRMEVVE